MPFFRKEEKPDFTTFKKEIKKFEKDLSEKPANKYEKRDYYKSKEFDYTNVNKSSAESSLHPFNFNPNNLPDEKWKELGFDSKQIKIIKNYEAKGGKFRKKEDLKKIYGISASEYAILEPFIQIPETAKPDWKKENEDKSTEKKESKTYTKSQKNTEIIEINSADTTEFKKLKGIGVYYAKKIIAYREKLGGFYKKEQLLEVYGMDSARYSGFSDFVKVNSYLIKTINVNKASFEDMKAHPYIRYNIALSLVNYRQVHGNFATVADIKKSVLVTDKVYEKLSPYISVE